MPGNLPVKKERNFFLKTWLSLPGLFILTFFDTDISVEFNVSVYPPEYMT